MLPYGIFSSAIVLAQAEAVQIVLPRVNFFRDNVKVNKTSYGSHHVSRHNSCNTTIHDYNCICIMGGIGSAKIFKTQRSIQSRCVPLFHNLLLPVLIASRKLRSSSPNIHSQNLSHIFPKRLYDHHIRT